MPRIVTRNGTMTGYRLDAGTRIRLHWLQHVGNNYLDVADVTHTTLIRRAIALLVEHTEGLMESGEPGDLMHTLERYKLTVANAGAPIGVTEEQARILPVTPLSDIRAAIHRNAPTVLEQMQRDRKATNEATEGTAYVATAARAQ